MPMDTQSQFFVLHCSLLGKNRSHGCIKCFKNKVVLHLKKKAWAKLFSTLETNCATANSSCGSALSENNCPVGGEYVKKKWAQCNTPTELQLHERTSGWCECSIMWLQSTSKHFSFILFVQTVSSTMLAGLQQHCSWEPLNHWGPFENELTWNICNSSSLHEVLCVHTNTVCTAGHSWSRIRDKRNPLLNV